MKALHRWKHDEGCTIGAHRTSTKSTGSKQRGIVYHRRVYKALKETEPLGEGWELLVEPWFRNMNVYAMRSPDAVLLHREQSLGIVIEVKLNWKDGRDVKLIDEYLPIVQAAFGLSVVWPALVTQCLRGYKHPPLLGLKQLDKVMSWFPGEPTPLVLVP